MEIILELLSGTIKNMCFNLQGLKVTYEIFNRLLPKIKQIWYRLLPKLRKTLTFVFGSKIRFSLDFRGPKNSVFLNFCSF
jgi:hypothetical protein